MRRRFQKKYCHNIMYHTTLSVIVKAILQNGGHFQSNTSISETKRRIALVIISPSVKELQRLLDVCAVYGQTHDILFNDDKTVCMFMPAKSSFYINTPTLFLNGRRLTFTVKYKYLGTLITHDGSDEANMSRQRGFFMRAAMVYRIISTHVRLL